MGLFSKLKNVLSKTRDGISNKLFELFAKGKIGEEFYEELEDILISSDVSVSTTMEIVDEIASVPTDYYDRPKFTQRIKTITLVEG